MVVVLSWFFVGELEVLGCVDWCVFDGGLFWILDVVVIGDIDVVL